MSRGFIRVLLAVAACVAAIVLPASASAGDPVVSLKVAKHKDGPYKTVQTTHIAPPDAKDFYWKVRNPTDAKLPDVLLTAGEVSSAGWIARWFRGDDQITSDVEGGGYEFALRPGKSKLFRSRLKPTEIAKKQLCFDAYAGPPLTDTDGALVAVNEAICLF